MLGLRARHGGSQKLLCPYEDLVPPGSGDSWGSGRRCPSWQVSPACPGQSYLGPYLQGPTTLGHPPASPLPHLPPGYLLSLPISPPYTGLRPRSQEPPSSPSTTKKQETLPEVHRPRCPQAALLMELPWPLGRASHPWPRCQAVEQQCQGNKRPTPDPRSHSPSWQPACKPSHCTAAPAFPGLLRSQPQKGRPGHATRTPR